MRILSVFGKHNYGSPERGKSIEYVSFLPAFRRLGHEVLFFESMNRDFYKGFGGLNRSLLTVIEKERPDILFAVVFTFEIWLETLKIIRDSGITATVNWATDDTWKYSQASRFITPYVHACTTTYPRIYERYKRDGINHVMLTQWAANAETLHAPIPAVECKYSVSFVGTAHGARKNWIHQLRKHGIEVDCFGYGWPNGPVSAEEIPRIIRESVISLNFSNAGKVWDGLIPRQENQIKARTFEVPGAGGFLLTEWAEYMDRHYLPGKEIAVFHDLKDLIQNIQYYLAHPAERDQIAAAGYARTQREHTYDHRLAEVLNFAIKKKEAYDLQNQIIEPQRISWEKLTDAEKRHKLNIFHIWLRKILVFITILVWGPERGPRASRMLVYQISIRLSGAHTYSSAGWPGRMFYKES